MKPITLQDVAEYHYKRWEAAISLYEAKVNYEFGDEQYSYLYLLEWQEALWESNLLHGHLNKNPAVAYGLLKAWI